MSLKWTPTAKRNGWWIKLKNDFIYEKVDEYLDEIGRPYGVFIGYGRRLFLMDTFNNKSQRKAFVRKIEKIHKDWDDYVEIRPVFNKLFNAIGEEVERILDERGLPHTQENFNMVADEVLHRN